MLSATDIERMLAASILYYTEGLTQQEIAGRMNTTRQSVSKLLNDAKASNIVEIRINNPLEQAQTSSELLRKKYGLLELLIVPGTFSDNYVTRYVVAQRAAEYIQTAIKKPEIQNVAISWGRTVYETIRQLKPSGNPADCRVFPLMGSSENTAEYYGGNEMVRTFALATGAQPVFIYMPIAPDDRHDYELLTGTGVYRRTIENWCQADMAVIGIGSVPFVSDPARQKYPYENEIIQELGRYNIVGDLCTKYFDADGNIYTTERSRLLVTATEEQIRAIPNVVAVAGGADKRLSIHGALKTGLVNTLITDEDTAAALLAM